MGCVSARLVAAGLVWDCGVADVSWPPTPTRGLHFISLPQGVACRAVLLPLGCCPAEKMPTHTCRRPSCLHRAHWTAVKMNYK